MGTVELCEGTLLGSPEMFEVGLVTVSEPLWGLPSCVNSSWPSNELLELEDSRQVTKLKQCSPRCSDEDDLPGHTELGPLVLLRNQGQTRSP